MDQSGLEDEAEVNPSAFHRGLDPPIQSLHHAVMSIRRAKESDLSQLSQLIVRSVSALNAVDDSPEDIAFVCAKHDVQNLRRHLQRREVFVLEINDQLAGIVSLEGHRLHSLFVEPNIVKLGHGKTLVNHIESLARSKGVSLLKVSSSRTAVPFYEKLGFRKLNFEPREFASTWAMEKQLTPASSSYKSPHQQFPPQSPPRNNTNTASTIS